MYPFYEIRKSEETHHFTIFTAHDLTFPSHLHPHVELIYVIDGTITVSINDYRAELKRGDIAVSFPNDIHSYSTDVFSRVVVLIFSPEIIGSYFSGRMDKTLDNPFLFKDDIEESIITLINMLLEEHKKGSNEYILKGLLYSIFGKLNVRFAFKDSNHSYDNTIQKVLKYIGSNFHENITLESTARDLGFSKFHISRLFSSKIKEQFNDYVNRLRINMAQKLLTETETSISSVAMECGFESIRNFNRVFKKWVGATPTEFRNQYKRSR